MALKISRWYLSFSIMESQYICKEVPVKLQGGISSPKARIRDYSRITAQEKEGC
jgi:hypothetical protein